MATLALRLSEELGVTRRMTLEYDFESLADDWHMWLRCSSDSLALAPEEGLVCAPPVCERPVSLALYCRELCADF